MNTITQTAKEIFLSHLTNVPTIEFDAEWYNGTGYLDGAVNVTVDKMHQFEDTAGRVGVLIPICEGYSAVMYQRYANDDNVFVSNVPAIYRTLGLYVFGTSNISIDRIETILMGEKFNGGVFTAMIREVNAASVRMAKEAELNKRIDAEQQQ